MLIDLATLAAEDLDHITELLGEMERLRGMLIEAEGA